MYTKQFTTEMRNEVKNKILDLVKDGMSSKAIIERI